MYIIHLELSYQPAFLPRWNGFWILLFSVIAHVANYWWGSESVNFSSHLSVAAEWDLWYITLVKFKPAVQRERVSGTPGLGEMVYSSSSLGLTQLGAPQCLMGRATRNVWLQKQVSVFCHAWVEKTGGCNFICVSISWFLRLDSFIMYNIPEYCGQDICCCFFFIRLYFLNIVFHHYQFFFLTFVMPSSMFLFDSWSYSFSTALLFPFSRSVSLLNLPPTLPFQTLIFVTSIAFLIPFVSSLKSLFVFTNRLLNYFSDISSFHSLWVWKLRLYGHWELQCCFYLMGFKCFCVVISSFISLGTFSGLIWKSSLRTKAYSWELSPHYHSMRNKLL